MFDALFTSTLLPFTIPLLLALGFGLMSLFSLPGFDAEADLDADMEAPGLGHALGFGLLPLSLLLTLWLLLFGLTGLFLHTVLGSIFSEMEWSGSARNALFIPAALLVSIGGGSRLARALGPLFQDHGPAPGARDLVGKIGVLKSTTVSPTFGAAIVNVGGNRIEIAARTPDSSPLRYGDRIVVFDFDPERNVYYVGPFEEESS